MTHVNPKLYTKCPHGSLISMKSHYKSYSQHEMQVCLLCHCFPFVVFRLGNDWFWKLEKFVYGAQGLSTCIKKKWSNLSNWEIVEWMTNVLLSSLRLLSKLSTFIYEFKWCDNFGQCFLNLLSLLCSSSLETPPTFCLWRIVWCVRANW